MEDQNSIKKWWEYIDGELEPAEKEAFLQDLEKDGQLTAILQEAETLEEHLVQIETEEPALRFSLNVLEKLPSLYKKVNIEPVFGRKTLILGSLILLISIILTYLAALSGSTGPTDSKILPSWLDSFQAFPQLPNSAMVLAALSGFCLVSVYLMDQLLKKRFIHKIHKEH